MAGYVGRLEPGDVLDARQYFAGPWGAFERAVVDGGASREFAAEGVEFAIFVSAGSGEFEVSGARSVADVGTAVTVGHGAAVIFSAGNDGLELFVTTVLVDPLE